MAELSNDVEELLDYHDFDMTDGTHIVMEGHIAIAHSHDAKWRQNGCRQSYELCGHHISLPCVIVRALTWLLQILTSV